MNKMKKNNKNKKDNKNDSKPKEEGNIIIKNSELDNENKGDLNIETKEKAISSQIKSENNEINLNYENDILIRLNNLENEMQIQKI